MSGGRRFKGWVNPLAFLEIDKPWAEMVRKTVDPQILLNYICTPGMSSKPDDFVSRYKEISVESARLHIAPDEEHILTKLIWPLRHAKACYMAGNYLGTISLCGMVAEMVAMLIFEISEPLVNEKPITREQEIGLFGSEFEKLGQERRVAVLKTYNLIDDQLQESFDLIRAKRRRYLHIYSQEHDDLPKDAVEVFKAAVSIVVKTIGQDVRDGAIVLNPTLLKYLEKQGIVEQEIGGDPNSPA